jgi:flagellar assembly protein FliH
MPEVRRSTVLKSYSRPVQPFETAVLPSQSTATAVVDDALVSDAREAGFREGFDAGYTAGHTEGMQAAAFEAQQAEAERAARLQPALQALEAAAARFDAEQGRAFTDVEDALAAASFALLHALLGRELALATAPGRDAVARALALAPERLPVRIHLNPEDAATITDAAQLAPGRDVTIVPDPALAPGDARVEVGSSRVDAILGDAVERVRVALGLDGAA